MNRGRASDVGIVRSPILTTLTQVSSRLLLVWGVVDNYPTTTSPSPFYSSMLLAWSITEIIRYSYFMFNLVGSVPGYLTWLRYNTFYVLYPVGITSEMLLIFYASNITNVAENLWQQWALRGILLAYVPGSFGSFQPRHREKKNHPSANQTKPFRVIYFIHSYDYAKAEEYARQTARKENMRPIDNRQFFSIQVSKELFTLFPPLNYLAANHTYCIEPKGWSSSNRRQ